MNEVASIDRTDNVAEQGATAFRQALGERLRAVVLFGSRARGDFRADSDWDMLVIAEGLPERTMDRYQTMKAMLPSGIRGATAIVARTPDEFEAYVPELYLDIALDGCVLYDRNQYVVERLGELRRTMDRAGLYRESTPFGNLWRWRSLPSTNWSINWERP